MSRIPGSVAAGSILLLLRLREPFLTVALEGWSLPPLSQEQGQKRRRSRSRSSISAKFGLVSNIVFFTNADADWPSLALLNGRAGSLTILCTYRPVVDSKDCLSNVLLAQSRVRSVNLCNFFNPLNALNDVGSWFYLSPTFGP